MLPHETAMVSLVMLALGTPANIGAQETMNFRSIITSLCDNSDVRDRLKGAGSLSEGQSIFRAQAAV